jgi:Ca2+-binding EF-hand superfamily protein
MFLGEVLPLTASYWLISVKTGSMITFRQRAMDLFRALDKDRSGSITKEEFIEGAFLLP